MPLPKEITEIVSEFGLPAGAIALAIGLVRGARSLEKDASPSALEYVSSILLAGNIRDLGKIGPRLTPLIFDRIFGKNPLKLKFVFRSIIASTIFWVILLIFKHVDWNHVAQDFVIFQRLYLWLIPMWYIMDWVSLYKVRIILRIMSEKFAIASTLWFVTLDVSLSFVIPLIFVMTVSLILKQHNINTFQTAIMEYVMLDPVLGDYIYKKSESVDITDVMVTSTLFTSIWTLLLFISTILSQMLAPIDYIRRFAAWWFRDVEKRPLTAIAKVAATLIVVIAISNQSGSLDLIAQRQRSEIRSRA